MIVEVARARMWFVRDGLRRERSIWWGGARRSLSNDVKSSDLNADFKRLSAVFRTTLRQFGMP
jgi:hypothetical protein